MATASQYSSCSIPTGPATLGPGKTGQTSHCCTNPRSQLTHWLATATYCARYARSIRRCRACTVPGTRSRSHAVTLFIMGVVCNHRNASTWLPALPSAYFDFTLRLSVNQVIRFRASPGSSRAPLRLAVP